MQVIDFTKQPLPLRDSNKLKVLLVGIAGTSRDILLAPAVLKSYALSDHNVSASCEIEILHKKYILPRNIVTEAEELAQQITKINPELVGFSTYCWNIEVVRLVCGRLRDLCPKVLTLVGGPEIDGAEMVRGGYDSEPFDFIVIGEGERAFVELLRTWLTAKCLDLKQIPRLAVKTPQGYSFSGQVGTSEGLIEDLSKAPSPYLTGALPPDLLRDPRIQANIETQRGCNLRCAYCLYHANFPRIRYRKPETVLKELEYLSKLEVRHLRITDANFFSDRPFAQNILQGMVDLRLQMSIFLEVIPIFVDQIVADLMAEYQALSANNQIMVGLGLQTINRRALKAIHRDISIHHFDRAFDLLSQSKVIIKTDLILGLPFETKSSWLDLMEYISEKMRYGFNYLSLAVLRLLPGTELKDIGDQCHLTVDNRNFDHFVYSTPDMPRSDFVDCLRISCVAFRLFHTEKDEERLGLRNFYFEIKDRLRIPHIEILEHLAKYLLTVFEGTMSDYGKPDFPNAEHYWYFDSYREIPDFMIRDELQRMLTERVFQHYSLRCN